MYCRIYGGTLFGIQGHIVNVEIDISKGLPAFNIVGLPDTAIKESRERVRSAIVNLGYKFPLQRITVNLSPSSLKKRGNFLDLPIALGILVASGQIKVIENIEDKVFVGGLKLDGKLEAEAGLLPISLAAKKQGFSKIILPLSSAETLLKIEGIGAEFFLNLQDIINFLEGRNYNLIAGMLGDKSRKPYFDSNSDLGKLPDFSDIKGQKIAKRALEIAVAGEHNVFLFGSPGCGKSLLASALPTIMPPLEEQKMLESAIIYSTAGYDYEFLLKKIPPFRSPHHSSSLSGIFGGGIIPVPGEISLAHNGILFLDELPEFPRSILEKLRQPLVEGKVNLVKNNYRCVFPSKVMLVAAANPCPCGYYGDDKVECKCSPYEISRYRKKLSGPFLDRIDIIVKVSRVDPNILIYDEKSESSSSIRKRVIYAREIQKNRYKEEGILTNGELNYKLLKKHVKLKPNLREFFLKVLKKNNYSSRSYVSILKVARTIADLDGKEDLEPIHLIEALSYRREFGDF